MMEIHLLCIAFGIFGIPNVSFPIMMDLLCNGDPYIVYLVCYTTLYNYYHSSVIRSLLILLVTIWWAARVELTRLGSTMK